MKRITVAPFSSRVRQRLPGAMALESFATESTVVCEPENQAMRPALFPPGELENITGVHEFSAGLENELHLVTRKEVHHEATMAWRLRNVCMTDRKLCNHRSYKKLTYSHVEYKPLAVEDVRETVAFCSSAPGNDFFAHFVLDDAATALLGKDFGRVVFGGAPRPPTTQMLDYLALCGTPYEEIRRVRFRDLWIFTDYSQNRHRRDRLQSLRANLRAQFSNGDKPPAYLRRGNTGAKRHLQNEAEIEALLLDRGFRILNPEVQTAEEMCTHLNGCPLVVGIEGSQLAHGLLNLRTGGGLLCIQPEKRFNATYRSFCNSLGLEWGFVVAAGKTDRFTIPKEKIRYALDLFRERIEY